MIGTQVYVTDDTGKRHLATITGEQRLFGPFKRYALVVEDSGQIQQEG